MPVLITNPSVEVSQLIFPGGEVHVQLERLPKEMPKTFDMRAGLRNSDDLMELFLVHNALLNHYQSKPRINLEIPYFPYARQDRVSAIGQAFSLEVVAKLIGHLDLESLTVWDAHSPVTTTMTGAINITQQEIIASNEKLLSYLKDDNTVLVCPDKGAVNKCESIRSRFSVNKMVYAKKVRNPETGKIEKTELVSGDLFGKTALIIDDICDGGRTFIEIAKKLKEKNIHRITLYVTHGIFSKGLEVFDGLIDEIFTTNSFPQKEDSRLTVIDFSAFTGNEQNTGEQSDEL